jgi:adenine-specific DNA-methyltransferase
VDSPDQAEDHIIFAAVSDRGQVLDEEQAKRMLSLPAMVSDAILEFSSDSVLERIIQERQQALIETIADRNARFFDVEITKLDGWAEDLKIGLERQIKELDRQIREARRAATIAMGLDAKLAGQKAVKELESKRAASRRALFEEQDRIDANRDRLIGETELRLRGGEPQLHTLFSVRWKLT